MLAGFFCMMLILCIPLAVSANVPAAGNYIVLILDISGTETFTLDDQVIYEADTAISDVKTAAAAFFDKLKKAPGDYYVAVVAYDDTATTVLDFTKDINRMKEAVNQLETGGRDRSIATGLSGAEQLLSSLPEKAKKTVLLYTTGMTDCGDFNYDGHYDENTTGSDWESKGINLYAYANVAYDEASKLKQDANLYAVGLFQTMEGMPQDGQDIAWFFRKTVEDLSSSDEFAFEAERPDQILDLFQVIAGRITGVEGESSGQGEGKNATVSGLTVFLIILILAGAVIGLIALTRKDKQSMDKIRQWKESLSHKFQNRKG